MKKDHLEILLEDIRGNVKLVLEGHEGLRHDIQDLASETKEHFEVVDLKFEALNNKIDAVDEKLSNRLDKVGEKLTNHIDAVAADLKAHRADTEAHHGIYQVKES